MSDKSQIPQRVKIVEVGPRDGLQNEKQAIATTTKLAFIEKLADAGLSHIEAGSFVNPRWVPQMADSAEVFEQLARHEQLTYSALTPNLKGFDRALEVKVDEAAIFCAASETFSQTNINCSIDESLARFAPIMEKARAHNIPVRGYISCVVGCPYEGEVDPLRVAELCQTLIDMGCHEVSLGDTIGVGTVKSTQIMLEQCLARVDRQQLAVHYHDTYGQALANIYAALELGISVIDSSVAGLGGCPYAKGASGNVATEDVIYLLNGLGIEHGIDLQALIQAGDYITEAIGKASQSKVAQALKGKEKEDK